MKAAILSCVVVACSVTIAGAQTAQHSSSQSTTTHSQGGAFSMGASKCHGPMDVSSDNFEGDMQTKVGTYSGNVIVVQATCKLRADKVVAEAVSGNDLNRLTAVGNVVFNSTSGTAVGDNGVYDLGPKLLTLTGKVVLTKGKDVMRGTRLVVDVNTGVAHLTAKGMPGGRVQSSFIPKETEGSNTPPAKSKPAGDDGN
jgi:lipopolysaccharide export system protein LptA